MTEREAIPTMGGTDVPEIGERDGLQMSGTAEKQRQVQAWAVKSAREWTFGGPKGPSRARLAQALTEATGKKWSATMVRNLEIGQKQLSADLLPVLAEILSVPEQFLLYGMDALEGSSPSGGRRQTTFGRAALSCITPIISTRSTSHCPAGIHRQQEVTAATQLAA